MGNGNNMPVPYNLEVVRIRDLQILLGCVISKLWLIPTHNKRKKTMMMNTVYLDQLPYPTRLILDQMEFLETLQVQVYAQDQRRANLWQA